MPARASASIRAASISLGSISTENSAPSPIGTTSNTASAMRDIISAGIRVGVPPPQCSRDRVTPGVSRSRSISNSASKTSE